MMPSLSLNIKLIIHLWVARIGEPLFSFYFNAPWKSINGIFLLLFCFAFWLFHESFGYSWFCLIHDTASQDRNGGDVTCSFTPVLSCNSCGSPLLYHLQKIRRRTELTDMMCYTFPDRPGIAIRKPSLFKESFLLVSVPYISWGHKLFFQVSHVSTDQW